VKINTVEKMMSKDLQELDEKDPVMLHNTERLPQISHFYRVLSLSSPARSLAAPERTTYLRRFIEVECLRGIVLLINDSL
jgi:hypothetical protein